MWKFMLLNSDDVNKVTYMISIQRYPKRSYERIKKPKSLLNIYKDVTNISKLRNMERFILHQ